MRKIVAGLMMSVDVVEAPETWTGPCFSPEIGQPGQNINISGSATLVAWLLSQGLLDELNLLLFPIVVGHGKRLFGDEGPATALTLAHCESFSIGVAQLIYHPASNA